MANRAFEIALALFLFLSMVSFLSTMMPTDQTVTTSEFDQTYIDHINETAHKIDDPDVNIIEKGVRLIALALICSLLVLSFVLQATILLPIMLLNFGIPTELSLMITGAIWIIYAVGLYNMFQAKQGI